MGSWLSSCSYTHHSCASACDLVFLHLLYFSDEKITWSKIKWCALLYDRQNTQPFLFSSSYSLLYLRSNLNISWNISERRSASLEFSWTSLCMKGSNTVNWEVEVLEWLWDLVFLCWKCYGFRFMYGFTGLFKDFLKTSQMCIHLIGSEC
jgi:hypothetical protein